jgi:Sec-independent protein translocase protein TatA
MHFSELVVVIIIAIVVFPQKKLPELAQTLARFIRYVKTIKNEIFTSLEPLEKHIQLEDNKKKAEEAEK